MKLFTLNSRFISSKKKIKIEIMPNYPLISMIYVFFFFFRNIIIIFISLLEIKKKKKFLILFEAF